MLATQKGRSEAGTNVVPTLRKAQMGVPVGDW